MSASVTVSAESSQVLFSVRTVPFSRQNVVDMKLQVFAATYDTAEAVPFKNRLSDAFPVIRQRS
jgi:hypothetical protein